MEVLVIGAGEVGFHLLKHLSREGHRVTLVDTDAQALKRAAQSVDVQLVEGHGGAYQTLERAGAATADLVCAVTNNDELNMLASLLARRMGARRSVVRIHAAQHVDENEFFYKDVLGFDLTVSPESMAAMEILRVCRGQNAAPVENFAGGRLQMRRLEVREDSPVAGRTLAQVKIPSNVLVTGVVRGTEVTIPRGDFELSAGDFVMLIGTPDALEKAEKVLGGRRTLPKRVMISGGGSMAVLIARDLQQLGVSVLMIEPDAEVCQELSRSLEGTEIIKGRGTDMELLAEEGVKRVEWFLSLDPSDEVNLLACQLAHQLGAAHTIALLQRGDYARLIGRFGVDISVSPRRLVARRIAQFVRSASEGSIARIHHGAAEVLDRLVPNDWVHDGECLRDIPFPVGSVVGGVVRTGEVFVPRGDTVINGGDHLIVFVLRDVVAEVQHLFTLREEGEPS